MLLIVWLVGKNAFSVWVYNYSYYNLSFKVSIVSYFAGNLVCTSSPWEQANTWNYNRKTREPESNYAIYCIIPWQHCISCDRSQDTPRFYLAAVEALAARTKSGSGLETRTLHVLMGASREGKQLVNVPEHGPPWNWMLLITCTSMCSRWLKPTVWQKHSHSVMVAARYRVSLLWRTYT